MKRLWRCCFLVSAESHALSLNFVVVAFMSAEEWAMFRKWPRELWCGNCTLLSHAHTIRSCVLWLTRRVPLADVKRVTRSALRDDNCQFCLGWTDIEWSLYKCNLQRKEKRKQKKFDKVQWESISSEDSLAVDPEDSEDTAEEESEMESGSLKSVATRFSTKRITAPRDSDHEPSPAPAKRSQRDNDGSYDDLNCQSNQGQGDSSREERSHEHLSDSWSRKGSSVDSGSSWSHSSTEFRTVCPAGSRSSADRSPAWSSSSLSWTTAGEGLAGSGSSQSWTTADCPAGVGTWGAGLPQTSTLDKVPTWAGDPRVWVQLESVPLGTRLLQTGPDRQWQFLLTEGTCFGQEAQSSWSWLWEPDYCRQSGSCFLQEPDILWQVSVYERSDQYCNPVCLELRPQCTLECHWKKNCW